MKFRVPRTVAPGKEFIRRVGTGVWSGEKIKGPDVVTPGHALRRKQEGIRAIPPR
jgi:hypothetical protein